MMYGIHVMGVIRQSNQESLDLIVKSVIILLSVKNDSETMKLMFINLKRREFQ